MVVCVVIWVECRWWCVVVFIGRVCVWVGYVMVCGVCLVVCNGEVV